MHCQRAELPLKLCDSAAAEAYFAGCFKDCDPATESLFVAHLDAGAHCLHLSQHRGDACSADFPLKDIIAAAVSLGTAGLVLAHNHPSGDPRPSLADFRATRRLATVAEALDCSVLDHFVFGGADCTSLRRLGLL